MDRTELPQGRDGCPRCVALERRVAELEGRLATLEDRLRADSANTSMPPSATPTWGRKPVTKPPTGRTPGGQPGHAGHHRAPLPPEEVDRVVEHRPAVCRHCGAAIPPGTEGAVSGRHQVVELPPRAVVVTEHRSLACRCRRCRRLTRGTIPRAYRLSTCGPRLSAALCWLSARVHGSRRAVEELVRQVLGVPVALGSVSRREAEMAGALAGAYERLRRHVRDAPARNVDETGWRRAGRWLWAAVTPSAACLAVDHGRDWPALRGLLGDDGRGHVPGGCVGCDRHGVYQSRVPLRRRALCWAHLKRDFQRWIDRGVPALGRQGLAITAEVCRLWALVRRGTNRRATLRRKLGRVRRRFKALLRRGRRCGVAAAERFCRRLLRLEPAYFTFARVEGLEPTNNHAERVLRPAVIWRKTCFGSHSPGGCRFAERMLSVIQTLRLQHRPAIDFLADTLDAHRSGNAKPSLI